jgi:phage terminase Nu1 subunit (DNA packaging protein)
MNAEKPKEPQRFYVKTQGDLARFVGQSVETIKTWAKRGMPGKPGRYEVGAIVRWARASGPWQQYYRPPAEPSDDPLLAEGDSPGLERYRMAKAAIAELDLDERKGVLLSTEKVRAVHARWATIFKRMGERVGKRYGADAAITVNDAIEECERVIENEFGERDIIDGGFPEGNEMGAESGKG